MAIWICDILLPWRELIPETRVTSLACAIWANCVCVGRWHCCSWVLREAHFPRELWIGKIWFWGIPCQLHCFGYHLVWCLCCTIFYFSGSFCWWWLCTPLDYFSIHVFRLISYLLLGYLLFVDFEIKLIFVDHMYFFICIY